MDETLNHLPTVGGGQKQKLTGGVARCCGCSNAHDVMAIEN
jgi:hypothetical protein